MIPDNSNFVGEYRFRARLHHPNIWYRLQIKKHGLLTKIRVLSVSVHEINFERCYTGNASSLNIVVGERNWWKKKRRRWVNMLP
jgi:hypothetical protein